MESIWCIFFCSAIVCSVMRSCSKFVFQLCSVRQYRKLQKVFVQIKKDIITKLWYRKLQNKTFELRHSLSCRFQVVLLLLVLSEDRDKGFSETSWICSTTSVLPYKCLSITWILAYVNTTHDGNIIANIYVNFCYMLLYLSNTWLN